MNIHLAMRVADLQEIRDKIVVASDEQVKEIDKLIEQLLADNGIPNQK